MFRALIKRDTKSEGKNRSPHLGSNRARNPAPKPTRVTHLYPVPEPEARAHARRLLTQIQTYVPEAGGSYVPVAELKKFYGELAAREGWTPRHWTVIGRHLSEITERRRLRRAGRQFCAYRIPR